MERNQSNTETNTATGLTSDNNDLDSMPLTDSQLEYYNVLRKEHSDWKKELEKAKLSSTVMKQEMSYIQIGVKQMKKFEDDIFEIEASLGQVHSLDEEIETLINKMTRTENTLSAIYEHSFNNIYRRIEQNISSPLITN